MGLSTKLLATLALLSCWTARRINAQDAFITTWKTDNPGSSCSTCITVPVAPGVYDYDVDWDNDGTYDEFGLTGTVTHDFGTVGTYTIAIRGVFPRFVPLNFGEEQKILSVDQWGDIVWASMKDAFRDCSNLVLMATDAPDLANVTDMNSMFLGATEFDGDVGGWDVSNVVDMNSMFYDAASFNGDISNWNVGNVCTMGFMFYGATSFNRDIGNWNVSGVTGMLAMFQGAVLFNADIGNWEVGNVMGMGSMFKNATSFNRDLGTWDVSNVVNIGSMFLNAVSFDQDLGSWTFNADASMLGMLGNCGMSVENYDNTLIGWNDNTLTPNNRNVGVNGLRYCNGEAARTNLMSAKGWIFSGTDIKDCSLLPVELVSFKAFAKDEKSVQLEWSTQSESVNLHFEVERSNDGTMWEGLAHVPGHGTVQTGQRYGYTDKDPLAGQNYYRLKQVDFDGTYGYSEVRIVEFRASGEPCVSFFPIPVDSGGSLNIFFTCGPSEGRRRLRLYDLSGNLVLQQFFVGDTGQQALKELAPGFYLLEITSGGVVWRERLVVSGT